MAPVGPYVITPALPITTSEQSAYPLFAIRKTNGEAWTTAEVEALKFNFDGELRSSTAGSSVQWYNADSSAELNVQRGQFTDTLSVNYVRRAGSESHTITAFE